jgi:CheY-like chemotaxis protein
MKILLVDDTELFIDLEKSYLQRETFRLTVARSGEEALQSIRKDRPDLIILDLLMPGISGDDVCRQLKSDASTETIPVVMVSSDNEPGLKERCYSAGCDAFVAKPLKRDELLKTIDRLILVAQRRHSRIPTRILAYVRSEKELHVESWILTLSSGGLFLEMEPAPKPGTLLKVAFPMTGVRGTVRATVKVRWCGKVRDGGPEGVGVEFIEIGDNERDAIKNYVEEKLSTLGSLRGFA